MAGRAGAEIVVIVDREDNVVGSAPRSEMRARRLPHRATYILVLPSEGRLLVQKRTATKDVYPGLFDPVAGGVVLAGETYEEGAARELEEEMGISGVPLRREFKFWFEDAAIRVWGCVFSCHWSGPVTLQGEEVEYAVAMTFDEIEARPEQFTPDGLFVVRRYREEAGKRQCQI